MKVKKITKIITILLIVATILSAMSVVFGASIPSAISPASGVSSLNTIAGNIIFIVQIICYATAVVMLMVLGVKWIIAAPEAKAEIKKSAVYYVVGAVMVFAAGILLGIIKDFATGLSSSSAS